MDGCVHKFKGKNGHGLQEERDSVTEHRETKQKIKKYKHRTSDLLDHHTRAGFFLGGGGDDYNPQALLTSALESRPLS